MSQCCCVHDFELFFQNEGQAAIFLKKNFVLTDYRLWTFATKLFYISQFNLLFLFSFRFADHFSGHLKLFLIVFMALSFYTILLICYVFTKVIPFSDIIVYVMFGLSGFFLNGTIPFFFELGVEITYPVAEGITSGVTTFANNFLQSIFLVVPLGHLGTKWMIWATASTCAVSTILLLFVKERYNRSAVDRRPSFASHSPLST